MTSRHLLGLSFALLLPSSLLVACGSSVEVPGEAGGSGTTSTSTTTGTGTGGTTTGTGGTGGTTTGTGGTGAVGGFGTGGSAMCGALNEVGCLGAYPDCVPVYDDKCCPSCDGIGACADCVDLTFHHCAPKSDGCGGTLTCGFTPDWACQGGKADCEVDPGGSPTPCHKVAGCTAGYCPTNADCKTDPVCTPVTKDICINACDAIPPPCAPGLIAESNGFCYTGLCVAESLCGFAF
jgi:hypothetical protein